MRRTSLIVPVVAAFALTSCGSDSNSDDAGDDAATTEATNDTVTTEAMDDDGEGADEETVTTDAMDDDEGDDNGDEAATVVDQATVDAAAEAFLEEQAAQGVTAFYIAVSGPDRDDVVSAYGDASVDGPEATVDDSFRIGSITKTVTATIILELAEAGELDLDDPIGALLPESAAEFSELESLTVRQLLAMESGLADYLNVPDAVVPEIVADPTRVWEPEELIAAGIGAGVDEPGTLGYSTTNFIVLQLIAEELSGKPFEELVAINVAEPLDLDGFVLPPNDDTTLPDPATSGYVDGGCLDELAADGATVEPGTDVTDWNASYGQGGGGMTATIGSLLGWAESGTGNALLADVTIEQRLEAEVLPEGIPYGLGIMELGPWIGHEGEAIGWEALALHDPDAGVSIAMAGNGCGGLFTGFLEVLGALYPESVEGLVTS